MSPALAEIEQVADQLVVPIEEIRHFTELVYALDVEQLKDHDFDVIERLIDKAVCLLSVDSTHQELITRLSVAREGIEQGVSADPAKRPSIEEMRRYVAARL